MNTSRKHQEKTLQLWIFTDKEHITPRYDQKSFDIESQINTFVNVVPPHDKNDGNALWVFEQTFLNLSIFENGKTTT